MAFKAIEKLINMHDGYRKQFVANRQEMLLIQEAGEHYIIQSSCPHKHWPLQTASINNGLIVCAKHGMQFMLSTGQAANKQAKGCQTLKVFKVEYEGNAIGLNINTL